MSIEDAEGIAQAHADLNALDIIQQAWVGEELINRLVKLESAQTDAAALIAEITAVGNADDITWENYTTYTDKLAAAENFYNAFVDKYGEEDTAKLITNADDLTDLRSAYDAAEDEAKEKEKAADIKAVEDLITAIGPVTEENYESKKEPIEAAEAALSSLKSKYGDAVASDVTNLETLTKAREDYDKFANAGEAGGALRRREQRPIGRRDRRAVGAAALGGAAHADRNRAQSGRRLQPTRARWTPRTPFRSCKRRSS